MIHRRLAFLVALATLLLVPAVASAQLPMDCTTPRNAALSVFAWLQPDTYNPSKAARCLDSSGRTQAELAEVAKHIKAVYDAKALHVKMEDISNEKGWINQETGVPAFAPHPGLPDVMIERAADGRWLWTRASLDRIERIYSESFSALDSEVFSKLPDWLRGKVLGVAYWQYLAILLALLLGLVLRKVIQFIVLNRLRDLVEKRGQRWALKLVDVFASPGATLIMAGVLRVFYPSLRLPIKAALAMSVAVRVLIVVSIVWAVYRLADVVAERMAEKAAKTESKLDDQLVPLIRKSLKILTIIAGGLFILQNLNVNVGSLLAGLGIGGIAVALAAKDTVANFFGSIMIFADRPFQIGDWVQIAGVEGIVEEVGFRSTRIRTFYNSLVTVPNARFMEANIDNYGVREYRRSFFTLNLTYDTTPEQMQAFVEGIRALIQSNEHTRKDYYEVHMSGFGAHSLDVMVYFFFKVDSWSAELRERHNVMLEIMRLARDLGVEFAFPTQTLHVDSLAEPGAERQLPPPLEPPKLAEVVDAFGPRGERARPKGPKITKGYFADTAPAAQSAEDGG